MAASTNLLLKFNRNFSLISSYFTPALYHFRHYSSSKESGGKGKTEREPKQDEEDTVVTDPYLPPWPKGINPHTGERGGPRGPEPTRYGDWERKGRVTDF